jgi:hypothetical protein
LKGRIGFVNEKATSQNLDVLAGKKIDELGAKLKFANEIIIQSQIYKSRYEQVGGSKEGTRREGQAEG